MSIAGEAQLDERPLNKWKVVGSSPASCTAAWSVGKADRAASRRESLIYGGCFFFMSWARYTLYSEKNSTRYTKTGAVRVFTR